MKVSRFVWAILVAVAIAAMFSSFLVAQRRGGGVPAEALSFRFLGPVVGNRVASIAGVPGDPYVYYAGAASGGIWKTTDGGMRWTPISDSLPVAAIGALAVAPSDPNVVWAGTGEAWAIRDSDVIGDGMYRSTDAGKTWTHAGLDETGRIARILIHPTNPDIVFACATGRLTAPPLNCCWVARSSDRTEQTVVSRSTNPRSLGRGSRRSVSQWRHGCPGLQASSSSL